jgi:hypothetical protein
VEPEQDGLHERLTAYFARVGNRAWWALAAMVLVVALFALVGGAAGPIVILAIQLSVIGLVVYIAVRLALRHNR